jgi:hypothetical protein
MREIAFPSHGNSGLPKEVKWSHEIGESLSGEEENSKKEDSRFISSFFHLAGVK